MRTLILLVAITLVAGCAADEQDILLTPNFAEYAKAAALTWNDAWAAGDADAIANMYAADAMVLPSFGEPVVGRADIREYWAAVMILDPGGSITSVESGSNGDLAFERGTYISRDADSVEFDHGKYLVAWKVVDGDWKIFRDMSNSSGPDPSAEPVTE